MPKVLSNRSHRSSLAPRRSLASRAVTRRNASRPVRGRTTGTIVPLTSGKDRSQVASCTTTGTTSQRRSIARSHCSSSSGTRKSDRTKTNVPGGSDGRSSKRCWNERASVSCGAPNGRRSWLRQSSCWLRGGRQKTSPSAKSR